MFKPAAVFRDFTLIINNVHHVNTAAWLWQVMRPVNDILYHKTTEPGANSTGRGRFQWEAASVFVLCVSLCAPENEEM